MKTTTPVEQKARVFFVSSPEATGHTHAAMAGETNQPRPDHEAYYSGLEVVETGPEVVNTNSLPEVSHSQPPPPHAGYAEYKHHSPPQALHEQAAAYSYALPGSPESRPPYSGSTSTDHQYNGGQNPYLSAEKPSRDERILGLKKKVFWIVLALFGAGIITGLAVGLGVGLGVRTSSSASSATTTTTSSSSTTVLPAATATATADASTQILCPAANKTMYTLATSAAARRFLVLCGRDYNSDGGAQDILSVNTTTFEGCLNECGSTDGCTAVGWGNYYGINTCWLKSTIGSPSWSSSWYAAVEDSSG